MIGIYAIRNKETGMMYIGSSIDIDGRWKNHMKRLRTNFKCNPYMREDYKAHGEESFELMILEECEESQLAICEQKHIDRYRPEELYNMQKAARHSNPMSNEVRVKISKNTSTAMKGRSMSDEAKRNMSRKMHEVFDNPLVRAKCNKFNEENPEFLVNAGKVGAKVGLTRRMRKKALKQFVQMMDPLILR